MNKSNSNEKSPKNSEISKMKKARRAAAAIFIGATGGALAVNTINSDNPSRESNPITTEAPAQTTVETVKNPETIKNVFTPKVASFIESLNSDTSGRINKVQLAPNGAYQEGFTQFSYITERDGMLLSVNVTSETDKTGENPSLDTMVEFSASIKTPGAVPPTEDNPMGDLVVSSIQFSTGEGTKVVTATSDSNEFKILENNSGEELSQPDAMEQISLLIDSMEQFAIPIPE